jgi:putative flippase GtrA
MPGIPRNALDDSMQARCPEAASRPLLQRGWRYTLVGLFCAVANNVILISVDWAGGHYLLGTIIAFSLVTPTAYLFHSRFTFGSRLNARSFWLFSLSIAATYPIVLVMLFLLCSVMHVPVAIAAPVATVALFLWNFAAAHWAILPRLDLNGEPDRLNS